MHVLYVHIQAEEWAGVYSALYNTNVSFDIVNIENLSIMTNKFFLNKIVQMFITQPYAAV